MASLVQAALVHHTTVTEQQMDMLEHYMMEMAKNLAVMKEMLQDLQELKDAGGLKIHSESSFEGEEVTMEELVTASQADSSVSTFPSCSLPTVLSSSHSSILCSGNLSQPFHKQETRNLQPVRSNACENLKNEKSNFSSHSLKPSSSFSTKLSKKQKLVTKYPHLLFVGFPKKKMRNRKFVKAKKKNVKAKKTNVKKQDFCYISTSKSNKLHCQTLSKFSIFPKSCFTWYVSPTDSGYSFNSVRKKKCMQEHFGNVGTCASVIQSFLIISVHQGYIAALL